MIQNDLKLSIVRQRINVILEPVTLESLYLFRVVMSTTLNVKLEQIYIENKGVCRYSKTCLQGTLQYPRECVPTSQVSLRHMLFNMGKIGHGSEKVSPGHRVSPHRSVP